MLSRRLRWDNSSAASIVIPSFSGLPSTVAPNTNTPPPSSSTSRTIERDDFQEFLGSHRDHRLEELKICEDSFVCERPYTEPVKESYFKATNGQEEFVIKKFRESIDEPMRYQLIHGDFSLHCSHIDIPSRQIKKQLEREFRHPPITDHEVRAFLKVCQYVAKKADVEKLRMVAEEPEHPLTRYYELDEAGLRSLLKRCHALFEEKVCLDIDRFIYHHIDDGVLALKATFEISFSRELPSRTESSYFS